MEHVAGIKGLTKLNLDDVRYRDENVFLTDEGLKKLAELPELDWLHIGKTDVSDAGLQELKKLKKLKFLDVTFCEKVTPGGIEKLKKELPALEVKY
jgi:hypothetical protein